MRNRILVRMTLVSVLAGAVHGCPFGGPNPVQRVRAGWAVQLAEPVIQDNVINLSALEDAADTVTAVQPAPNTVRVAVGGKAGFRCDVNTSEAARRIVWRHDGATIRAAYTPPVLKGHDYYRISAANTSYLFIHNVGRYSGGTVECLLPCGPDGDLCVLRTQHLQPEPPKLRAQDVFIPPMRSVSAPNGSFSMTCSGRVDCGQTRPVELFIWKYDEYFVAAPYPSLLGGDIPGLLNGSVTFNASAPGAADPFCASTLTLTIRKEAAPRSARVDCWLRPRLRSHEWFTQSAHIHFRVT